MKKKIIISIIIVLILIIGVIIGCIYFNKNINNAVIDENGVKYANDVIVVFLNSDVSESVYKQLVKKINGNIIGSNSISIQIKLNDIKFTSYDEILQYCQQLKEQHEEVKYAIPEMMDTTTVN